MSESAMHSHDGYQPHSHEVRADHLGVHRDIQPVRLPLADLPAQCPWCGAVAHEWPLDVCGHVLSVTCPKCFLSGGHVVAVREPYGTVCDCECAETKPAWAPPLRVILSAWMAEHGVSVAILATRAVGPGKWADGDWARAVSLIMDVVEDGEPLTEQCARLLQWGTGVAAAFWLKAESDYRSRTTGLG